MLTAVFAVGMVGSTPADARILPQATTCAGVWVVVDYGSLGGISTQCATSYGTGTAALKSAGFSPTLDDGMITRISGKPTKPDIYKAYWSYWQSSKTDDGGWGDWQYSNLGASSSHPKKGDAEGWRYQSLADGKVKPGAKPPTASDEPSPTPSPTKTTSKPSAKPSATKKPTATATPTVSATPTASATETATASASASPAVTPTPTLADGTPTPTLEAAGDAVSVEAEPTAPTDGGSPVGAMITGGVVLAGAAGLGGWWWLKGRKR